MKRRRKNNLILLIAKAFCIPSAGIHASGLVLMRRTAHNTAYPLRPATQIEAVTGLGLRAGPKLSKRRSGSFHGGLIAA